MYKFMKLLQITFFCVAILLIMGGSCNDTTNNPAKTAKITLSNSNATMIISTKRVFNAKAEGLANTDVTWSIAVQLGDAAIEQIDGNNVIFTAPSITGIVKIKATSVADPTVSAIVEITVLEDQETEVIFDNGNIAGVQSGPLNPTVFTIDRARTITHVNNYHYFNQGVLPGTISFKHSDGTTYGPWQCVGRIGQGGIANAYWDCFPGLQIKAGTYTVVDSHPATWSHNSGSNNCGFTRIEALK